MYLRLQLQLDIIRKRSPQAKIIVIFLSLWGELLKYFKIDACPHSICDGLFRVDVFMNQANEFIVNEFESLEAVYYGKSILENTVTNHLKEYWYGKLMDIDLIQELLSRTIEIKDKNKAESLEKGRNSKRKKLQN